MLTPVVSPLSSNIAGIIKMLEMRCCMHNDKMQTFLSVYIIDAASGCVKVLLYQVALLMQHTARLLGLNAVRAVLAGPRFFAGARFDSAAWRAFSINAPSSSVSVPLEISTSSSKLFLLRDAARAGEERPM